MKKSQSGFTLIELVVVIVLLGILGVTALGKFQDLSGEAEVAAVSGVASEMSAAAAINYSAGIVTGTPAVVNDSTAGADITADGTADGCDDADAALGQLFQSNTFPSGYVTNPNTAADCSTNGAGDTYNCTIANDLNGNGTYDVTDLPVAIATLICSGA